MAPYTKRFLYASLAYLFLGSTLGLIFTVPAWRWALLPGALGTASLAHAHLQLVGFVGMMIFGVAYHVIPRFSGTPLWRPGLADWHFGLAQVGLLGMAFGFIWPAGHTWLPLLGTLLWLSMLLFIVNMALTLRGSGQPRSAGALGLGRNQPRTGTGTGLAVSGSRTGLEAGGKGSSRD